MQKSSPNLSSKHRRSHDLTNSSEESLNNVSGRQSRENSPTPTGNKDETRAKSPDQNLWNQQDVIEEETASENVCQNASEAASGMEVDGTEKCTAVILTTPVTPEGPSVNFENVSSDDKSQTSDRKADSLSDGHSDKDSSRQTRERSFEKSLDNIMDKWSEKSVDLNLSVESWNGSASDISRTPDLASPSSSATKFAKNEKKKKSWYTMLAPTYKSKTEDFRKTFKDIPPDERLIVDYSCALQKDILVQGRMYITQNWICFYANIFRWETVLTISCKEVTAITKEKTARVIPNAIQITSLKEKYFFTSFGARDKTYMMLFRVWQNALMDQPMNTKELWQWIHYSYGEELGVTSSDEDYIPPPCIEELQEQLSKESLPEEEEISDSENHGEPTSLSLNTNDFLLEQDEVFQQPLESPITLSLSRTEDMTDGSDTTEDSEGKLAEEVVCSGHSHLQKMYLDEVFCIPVDKMFEYLFTDSVFFRQFVTSRKTYDLELLPWQEESDPDGNRLRNITYTLTLNQSLGPKNSYATEKQKCYPQSEPGNMYIIDTEVSNGGIPYADAFSVMNRYCLTRVSKSKSRLRVSSRMNYHRSLIGIVKGMIERSAVSGLTDYFRSLSAHLRREAESTQINHVPKKRTLRRRRKLPSGASDIIPGRSSDRQSTSLPPSPLRAGSEKRTRRTDTCIRVICFILILLVIFNALLFYKLWSLESYTNAMYFPHSDNVIDDLQKYPRSEREWVHLLKQQMVLQDGELDKWKDVLSASLQLIDQIKGTLVELHNTLNHRKRPKRTTTTHKKRSPS